MPRQHKVLKQGREIDLTNIEFRILYMLALHRGITLSKEKIYNYVWTCSLIFLDFTQILF